MKFILSWLSKPYYFNPSIKFKLKISFIFGLFVFLFLYVFRPFYLSLYDIIILEYTIFIAVIAFLGAFITLYLPPLIFKKYFNEDRWTIGRNIFLILLGILFVGVFLWHFGEAYKEPYGLKKLSLVAYISYTFLVTIIPITVYLTNDEKRIRRKRQKRIEDIKEFKRQKKSEKKQDNNSLIVIYSDNNKEVLEFKIKELVYITCQGNYASFYLKKENSTSLKESILRVTLTKIDNKLQKYPTIIRCHKSYIINSKFIKEITGNARGYLLKSDLISIDIPVSRSFSKQSLLSLLR